MATGAGPSDGQFRGGRRRSIGIGTGPLGDDIGGRTGRERIGAQAGRPTAGLYRSDAFAQAEHLVVVVCSVCWGRLFDSCLFTSLTVQQRYELSRASVMEFGTFGVYSMCLTVFVVGIGVVGGRMYKNNGTVIICVAWQVAEV